MTAALHGSVGAGRPLWTPPEARLHIHREAWLHDVTRMIRPWYGGELPVDVRMSVGFPSSGVRSRAIGECWRAEACGGIPQLFIHPGLHDPVRVVATLAHELIHACRPDAKHGRDFKKVALKLGLTGRMTATVPGDLFMARIAPVLTVVGPYPHDRITRTRYLPPEPKPGRLQRLECPSCGYLLYTSARWLEQATPCCPLHPGEVMK